jgi:hypothetical protein
MAMVSLRQLLDHAAEHTVAEVGVGGPRPRREVQLLTQHQANDRLAGQRVVHAQRLRCQQRLKRRPSVAIAS